MCVELPTLAEMVLVGKMKCLDRMSVSWQVAWTCSKWRELQALLSTLQAWLEPDKAVGLRKTPCGTKSSRPQPTAYPFSGTRRMAGERYDCLLEDDIQIAGRRAPGRPETQDLATQRWSHISLCLGPNPQQGPGICILRITQFWTVLPSSRSA